MNQKKINLKNINDFLEPISKLSEVKKLKMYKELGVSPTSFFLLRFLFQKYVVQGERAFITSDLLQVLSKSSFFRSVMDEKDKNNIGLIEGIEEDEEEDTHANAFINMQNYNEIDFFEEDFFEIGYIKYIECIEELIKFGYIQGGMINSNDLNIYQLFTEQFSITLDFLNIVNDGSLEIKEYKEKKAYRDYYDYLKEAFEFIKTKHDYMILKKRLDSNSPILKKRQLEADGLSKQMKLRLSKSKDIHNPMVEFFEKNELDEAQQHVVLALYRGDSFKESMTYCTEENLLSLYYDKVPDVLPSRDEIFGLSEDMLEYDYQEDPFTMNPLIFYFLSEDTLDELSPIPEKNSEEKEVALTELKSVVKENSDFEIIEPKKKIEDIVLSNETSELVNVLLNQLDTSVIEQLKEWGIKQDDNINARILFSGKPGTGKTATSHALGHALNRFIVSFDCSKILSMYVGESEKNVKSIFDTYRKVQEKLDYFPILLLNEADQFLSSRSTGQTSSADKMHNQMQNIFLEEIENFEGILIATTNLIENLDTAFSRRFNYKIDFKIPDREQRLEIWKKKITKKIPLEKDFDFEKLSSFELTGGQIELVLENTAMRNAVKKVKKFATSHFVEEIEKELNSSFDKTGKTMGFNV